MHGLNELREQGRMTWIEAEQGWGAAQEDIAEALSKDGFEECKRETTIGNHTFIGLERDPYRDDGGES